MAYQNVFKRYELKYIITKEQKELLLCRISPFIKEDKYGHSTIRNVYYDTDDYRLIRRSLERPVYKEKLRLRGYSKVEETGIVFAELKKKYESVVYKRRIFLSHANATKWISGQSPGPDNSQVSREISYFIDYYKNLKPTVFLSYEREAYYSKNDDSFRITFDENILCRRDKLALCEDIYGERVLDAEYVLMEVKTAGGIPLWLTSVLSEQGIYKTSFSKYGTAYQKLIFPYLREGE